MTPSRARDVLGLPPQYSADELRSAFRAMAKKLHPDNGGPGGRQFTDVVEAHDVLRANAAELMSDDARADVVKTACTCVRRPERVSEGYVVFIPQEFVDYSDVVVDCIEWEFTIPRHTALPWHGEVSSSRGPRLMHIYNGRRDDVVVPGSVTRPRRF